MSTGLWSRYSTVFWMTASLLVAAALAAITFGAVDAHNRVEVALQAGSWLSSGRLWPR
jgi:hypothetical protein